MKRIAAFIDMQGTMGDPPFGDIKELKLYPFTAKAIRLLNEHNILVIVITDQSHISKGIVSFDEYHQGVVNIKEELALNGARLDDIYVCPHSSKEQCDCKKPQTTLVDQANEKYDIDLSKSFMIGDLGSSDMLLGENIGATKILVKTGGGIGSLTDYKHLWSDVTEDYAAENIYEAAKWIINKM